MIKLLKNNSNQTECPPLRKSEIKEIKRRIKEMDDPTRYIVGDPAFTRKGKLRGFFYIIECNMYGMTPQQASPIKSIRIARAIQESLNTRDGKLNDRFRVYTCKIGKTKKLREFKLYQGKGKPVDS